MKFNKYEFILATILEILAGDGQDFLLLERIFSCACDTPSHLYGNSFHWKLVSVAFWNRGIKYQSSIRKLRTLH